MMNGIVKLTEDSADYNDETNQIEFYNDSVLKHAIPMD
jgi:hypothetical protein